MWLLDVIFAAPLSADSEHHICREELHHHLPSAFRHCYTLPHCFQQETRYSTALTYGQLIRPKPFWLLAFVFVTCRTLRWIHCSHIYCVSAVTHIACNRRRVSNLVSRCCCSSRTKTAIYSITVSLNIFKSPLCAFLLNLTIL